MMQNMSNKALFSEIRMLAYPPHKELYPFQRDAIHQTIAFIKTNQAHACYNACAMGLGKSVQAVVTCNTLAVDTVLVICPAIMRLVWRDEIRDWAEKEAPIVDTILTGADLKNIITQKQVGGGYNPHYLIISYDLASRNDFLNWAVKQDWDMLIMDEAHYLKNTQAKRTKAVLQNLWPVAKCRLALSGTPFTTRVVDGYSLFRRMAPGTWKDFNDFAEQHSYCQIKRINGRTIHDYFGIKNAEKLREILRSNFYVRYIKEQCLKELPDKVYNKITLPVKYAVLPRGRSDKEKLEVEAEMVRRAIENDKPVPIPASLAEHRRLQGENKVEPILEFIKDLLQSDESVVVFAWHKKVIAEIELALSEYKPSVITGETRPEDRRIAVGRFQRGETQLFIGNMQAAGVGITLTKSSTVVLAELDWSPTTVAQAIDRCHRIGQKDVVNVYYFVVDKSIDESITSTVMSRARTFKTVLDGN